ncbi:MAG TPA: signal peptidase I [Saprospiraceae bacterium]|nr:signal peptidase I [Saprospiraceae bacterium]
MGFWFILLISYLLLSVGLFFLFPKMGIASWKGLVPGINLIEWAKSVGRKPGHAAFILVPIVNIFIYAGLAIDTIRSFNHLGFWQSVLAVIGAPFYFLYLAFSSKDKYEGPAWQKEQEYRAQLESARKEGNSRLLSKLMQNNPYKKSALREWSEAIIFAVFAAAFIRMFLIEAYVIPTSSMEGSLLTGDFLFVSKAHYGIRMPQTVAMIPLLHNRIPVVGGESYLRKPSLKYNRLPALETIDRNDPVVFNYPEGDSVYVFPHRTWSVYDYRRGSPFPMDQQAISSGAKKLIVRPMDKMDHYIKRCVAVSGDSIQVINRQLYVNGKPAQNPKYIQYIYHLRSPNGPLNEKLFAKMGISQEDQLNKDPNNNSMLLILNEEQAGKLRQMDPAIETGPCKRYFVTAPQQEALTNAGVDNANLAQRPTPPSYLLYLTDKQAAQLEADSTIKISPYIIDSGRLFPHDPVNHPNWTVDDYGPLYVPKKGATVKLDAVSIAFYRRVISVYEGNQLEEKDGKFFINGQVADSYTFKKDYYWMMGDNRHNSEDARVWGYVPDDHVVGKPLFIWFSTREGSMAKGINWNRIFTSANKK